MMKDPKRLLDYRRPSREEVAPDETGRAACTFGATGLPASISLLVMLALANDDGSDAGPVVAFLLLSIGLVSGCTSVIFGVNSIAYTRRFGGPGLWGLLMGILTFALPLRLLPVISSARV